MKVKSESEVAQSCPTLATPWTVDYQAPPSMGFSMQKYWSGVPLPSPVLGFSIMQTKNFQMSKLDLEKEEEPEIKLPTFAGNSRKKVLESGAIAFSGQVALLCLITPHPVTRQLGLAQPLVDASVGPTHKQPTVNE